MKKTSHTGHTGQAALSALLEISLAVVPALLFFYTYVHHYPSATFFLRGNVLFFVVYFAILVLFMTIYGSFSVRKYRTRELVFAFGLSSFFTDTIAYFLMCMIAKMLLPPKYVILTLLLQCLVETGIFILARILADRLEPPAPALLIVPEKDAEENVRSKFDRRRTRYSIDRVVSADMPWEELCEIMHSYTTVVLMPMEKELRRRIMDDCFWHGIAIMLKPDMQDIMVNCADTVIMSDVPLCAVHTGNYDRGYLTAKRVLDVVASVCGLIICSPIFLAVAIAIKIQDGGPVFYRQKRLTLNGKPFYLTKFRSMVVNAESATGAVLAGKSDSRITKVGAFLRATRIDELPQLVNILKGDMSLIGFRPPLTYHPWPIEEYTPEQRRMFELRPGITGWAQVHGRKGVDWDERIRMSVYYVDHVSFLLDVKIFFMTIWKVFSNADNENVGTTVKSAAAQERPAEPVGKR